ncbi:MAG: NapC/NirT family cytochrome c [Sedimentisphaerales bacterium]|nr:NapC/NirT family cytochrome c [Sedimentisphaerales bacterium]
MFFLSHFYPPCYTAAMSKRLVKWVGSARRKIATFAAGLLFAMLCFVALNWAMGPVSTNEYCGSACHEMNTSYQTWELSGHGANIHGVTVDCIDCHLPPHEQYFRHVTAKAYAGAKDLYKHHFGPDYDRETIRQKVMEHMQNKTCVHCHDNLTALPGTSAARLAHMAAVEAPQAEENKCVTCHENAGHEREKKLFSP